MMTCSGVSRNNAAFSADCGAISSDETADMMAKDLLEFGELVPFFFSFLFVSDKCGRWSEREIFGTVA